MHLSSYLHWKKTAEGWRAVYNPFGHKIAFIYDEAWDLLKSDNISKVNSKIVEYLIKNNFLVDDGFEENWLTENRIEPAVRLNSMFLVITQNCNFGCKYCAVIENYDSGSRLKEKMSIETGRAAVDFFMKHLEKHQPADARITFYGGEPMLNQELMFDLVPYIRNSQSPQLKKPIEIVMITNGYLYNQKLTDLFKSRNVGICVSLDGRKRHQDVTRVLRKSNSSTYDRVIENYFKYRNAGLSMGISTALGKHNAFDLREISEFYAELGAPFVEFQIPYQVGNESNELWVDAKDISDNLMEAFTILKSKGIIEGTTYRRLRDFSIGKIRIKDCGSNGNQLVVAPDGTIGPCHSLVGTRTFFEGNVMDPASDPEQMSNFLEWAKRFPLNMPECQGCSFIALCGGGCTYNSYVANNTIWGKDPQVCGYMKGMVDWILLDFWSESGMASKYGTDKTIRDGK